MVDILGENHNCREASLDQLAGDKGLAKKEGFCCDATSTGGVGLQGCSSRCYLPGGGGIEVGTWQWLLLL